MRKLSNDEIKVINSIQASIGEKIPTAIYARKSKEDKSQEALDTQINHCQEFINQSAQHLKLKKVYQEDNVSGMTIDGRKEFKKLIDAIDEGFIKAVLVSKWDRFSRNSTDLKNLRESFSKKGAIVIAIEDTGEMNAVANLQFEIMAAINQYYVHKISEDTKSVLINLTSKGHSGGGVANYGYEYDENNRLVIRPDEAAIVAEIYDKFELNATYEEIIEDFKMRNITTRKGNNFTRSTLHSILTNVKYYGVYRYNRQDRQQSQLTKKHFDEVWLEEGIETPIITKEQFDEVQRILEGRKKTKKKSDYLLTGILECEYCGNKMTGSSQFNGKNKSRKKYYICSNHLARYGKTCKNMGIEADLIENQAKQVVLDTVNIYIKQGKLDESSFTSALKSKQRLKSSFNKSIDNLEQSKNQLIDRLVDPNTRESLRVDLEQRIEKRNEEINELSKRVEIVDEMIAQYSIILKRQTITSMSAQTLFRNETITKQLIKNVINSISVSNDGIEITILEK
ncbi:MAG: recombinase family protein [Firmicutes bacterium]|nr:recombinase family protein [Bacillota bacterium]